MTPTQKHLSEIRGRLESAHREICDLASGKRKWEMCVPPQSSDSDMKLQAPLDDIAKLISVVECLVEALEYHTQFQGLSGPSEKALAKAQRILEGK